MRVGGLINGVSVDQECWNCENQKSKIRNLGLVTMGCRNHGTS